MGLMHLDAGVVIGVLDSDDVHHPAAREVLRMAARSGDRVAMSASAFAECLVGPSRRGERAVSVVEAFCTSMPIEVVALDREVARRAARLRAQHPSLRLPDALVIATADCCSADRIVTTDRRWPSSRALGIATEIVHV
jgi:predicted nucleic acid-binding protein